MNFFKRLFGFGRNTRPADAARPAPAPPPGAARDGADGGDDTSADDARTFEGLIGTPQSDAPIVLVETGGAVAIMNRMAYEYQAGLATGGDPAQAELDAALARADRVRVLGGGLMRDRALGTEVLLDTRARAEIRALRDALRIVEDPDTFGHCACLGGPTFEFYAGKAAGPVATVALHHGHGLRWSRWKHDATLADPGRLAGWMRAHDLPVDPRPDPDDPLCLGLLRLSDAERYALRAESHRRRGEPRPGLDDCARALALDPELPLAYGVRALLYGDSGRYEEAEADCSLAVGRGLRHPEVLLTRAIAREALGRLDDALADCDAALELAPGHAGIYNSRALVRKRAGRAVEALADFARALELAPGWPLPAANRGMAHLEAGRFDRAAADFTEAIRRVVRLDLPDPARWRGGPDVSLAAFHALRAQALEAQGDADSARADYSRAAELDPDDPRVFLTRGQFRLRAGATADALDDFSEAVRIRPDLAAGYFERGRARALDGDLDEALADFSEAVRWAPDDPAPLSLRARVFLTRGQVDDALRDLDRVVRLAPDNPLGFYQRADCWAALGDHARRRDDMEQAVRLAPDWPEAGNSLAWLLATCPEPRWRDGPRAAEIARRAARSLPETPPELLDTLAAALAECGDFDQARDYQRQAIDLMDEPDRRRAYEHRLALYEADTPYHEPPPPDAP